MKTISTFLNAGLVPALLTSSLFLLSSCERYRKCPNATTQEFTVDKDFTKVSAGGDITFGITYDKRLPRYTIKATGCADDLSDIKLKVTDGVLDVRFSQHRSVRHRIDIRILSPLPVEVQYFKSPRIEQKSEPGWPKE